MKVNPYQAFEPFPAKVTLDLSVDRWTEVNTSWSNPITRHFSQFTSPLTRTSIVGSGNRLVVQSRPSDNVLPRIQRSESSAPLSSTSVNAEFMRQITQHFDIEEIGPGEGLETLLFDGIEIEPLEDN